MVWACSIPANSRDSTLARPQAPFADAEFVADLINAGGGSSYESI